MIVHPLTVNVVCINCYSTYTTFTTCKMQLFGALESILQSRDCWVHQTITEHSAVAVLIFLSLGGLPGIAVEEIGYTIVFIVFWEMQFCVGDAL